MWMKNFRHRRLQTFMLFIIVLLSTMALCGSISILISLDKPYHDLAKECNAAAASVWGLDGSYECAESYKEEFEELDEIDHASMFTKHYISEEMKSGETVIDSFTNLTEYNEDVFGSVRYVEGKQITSTNPLSDGECVVPACICIAYDLHVGDSISINLANATVNYKIRAIYAEAYGTTTAYDNFLLVDKLPDGVEPKYDLRLYAKEGKTSDDIEVAYREKHDGKMNCTLNGLETEIANNLFAGTLLGAILLAIGGILLVVSGLIIHFMVRHTMISDAKSIAIYKTIGYSSKTIISMYLKFYFVVVSAGCIFGILGSSFFVEETLRSMYQNIGTKASGDVLIPGICCFVVINAFVLTIIFFIMRKTKNIKPVLALNEMQYENTKKKKRYKGNLNMAFSSLGIALRTIQRGKRGTIGIIITSVVTIFAMNFAIVSLDVCNTMRENNDYWLGIESCDLMISLGEGVEPEEIKDLLKNRKEIEKMFPSNLEGYSFSLDWKKNIEFSIVIPFVYDDFDESGYSVLEGRNPQKADEIAISYKVARAAGKSVGDYLHVNMGEKSFNLLITGIYQTYFSMGKSARMISDTFEKQDIPFNYDYLSIYLKEGTDIDSFIESINDSIGNKGSIVKRTDMFSSIMTLIMNPQQKAIPAMTVLILLIGATNIFCSILLKNASSEKTNSIYKCVGYSTRHLIWSNVWYVCIIAGCSLVFAVPALIYLYPSIMKLCLSVFGLQEYKINYDILHIVLINIGVIVAFILSTVISSRSLRKVNVKNLVQE